MGTQYCAPISLPARPARLSVSESRLKFLTTWPATTGNQAGTKREPSGNQAETKREPSGNQAGTKREPSGNQAETKRKPSGNQAGTKREPSGNQDLTERKIRQGQEKLMSPPSISWISKASLTAGEALWKSRRREATSSSGVAVRATHSLNFR